MNSKQKKYLIAGCVIAIAIIVAAVILTKSSKQMAQSNSGNQTLALQDIPAPAGWYAHRINAREIIFTKQPTLPDIGNTESLAYGEQIEVSSALIDRPVQDWATQYIGDDVLAPAKQWGTLNGHQTVQAVVTTPGDQGMDYVIFGNTTAYIFFLYPYASSSPDVAVFQKMVTDFGSNI